MGSKRQNDIAEIIKQALREKPGDEKLPSVKQTAQKHGVSTATAKKVYERLIREAYVVYKPKAGYFSRKRKSRKPLTLYARLILQSADTQPFQWALQSFTLAHPSVTIALDGKHDDLILHDGLAPLHSVLPFKGKAQPFFVNRVYTEEHRPYDLLKAPPPCFDPQKALLYVLYGTNAEAGSVMELLKGHLLSFAMQAYLKMKGIGLPLLEEALKDKAWTPLAVDQGAYKPYYGLIQSLGVMS